MPEKDEILKMEGISKAFPGVQALDQVQIKAYKGEVLALMGENGAGKSTLMKILSGEYKADQGQIFLGGETVSIQSPQHARTLGISMIHQELALVQDLTVGQNIFMGREPATLGFINWKQLYRDTLTQLNKLHLDIPPQALVGDLSIAEQQMVEIAKALSFEARVIIMDEPTSALTDKETDILFKIIEELKTQGIAIIYISHRMNEIYKIADQVSVFRDGQFIGSSPLKEITDNEIVQMMVGRQIEETALQEKTTTNEEIFRIEKLNQGNRLKDISFSLNQGEILGVAGLVGAGRSELMRAIFGIDPITSGHIYIQGEKLIINSPGDAINAGLGFVPENRKEEGLFLNMSVVENITINILKRFSKYLFPQKQKINATGKEFTEKLGVKTPSLQQKVLNLSGGNQQKVVIAKWLTLHPKVLILDEPTRGIDVGAKSEIYALINQLAEGGMGIIMISSELPEILRMSNRILVMSEGEIKAEIPGSQATQDKIMHYAVRGVAS